MGGRTSRLSIAFALVIAGLWHGCGPVDRDPGVAPDGGSGSGGSDAGSGGGGPAADAGAGGSQDGGGATGGDGGVADAGSGGGVADAGGGGGVADAGGGGGVADAGGGGEADAGGGGGASDDGGGSATDAGSGGGVATGCEDVMPGALGEPVTAGITRDAENEECWSATSDERGNVAMEGHRSLANVFLADTTRISSSVHVNWFQFDPSGTQTSDARASFGLYPQANGFVGTVWSEPNQFLLSWLAVGRTTRQAFASVENPAIVARAWRSGVVAAAVVGGEPRSQTASITFWRFDGAGNLQHRSAAASMPRAPVVAAAEDASGVVAAFVMPWVATPLGDDRSGKLYVIWTDFQGRVTDAALVATGVDVKNVVVHPLVDGGLALRLGGSWAGVLKPFESTLGPAPAWLADRPGADFAIVRNERAYALMRSGSNSLELVSTQGSSCGTVTFPGLGGVTTGADGTVIGASGEGGCTKRWWTGLLK
jgi:hypothetical protein